MSAVEKKEVPFELFNGKTLQRRVLTPSDLNLIKENTSRLWGYCISISPLLLMHVEVAMDDMELSSEIEKALMSLFSKKEFDANSEKYRREFLRLTVILLCISTTVSTAEKLLAHERNGTFIGGFEITHRFLTHPQSYMDFDYQYAMVSNVVYHISYHRAPTRMVHEMLETLKLFTWQNDRDMAEVVIRVARASERTNTTLM